MNLDVHGPWFPIIASVGSVWLTLLVAHRLVPEPMSKKPYEPHLDDAIPLGVGLLGMFISAILNADASVWSYFIDIGAFIIGASLVATSVPKRWPRRVGLMILGIHFAQVLWTNSNAPLQSWVGWVRDSMPSL